MRWQLFTSLILSLSLFASCIGCSSETAIYSESQQKELIAAGPPIVAAVERANDLQAPIPLEADGKVIDIGELPNTNAHAGPCIGDIDADGDDDLLVGDFPGFFWFFENISKNESPNYAAAVKLQAGGSDAKVPVS